MNISKYGRTKAVGIFRCENQAIEDVGRRFASVRNCDGTCFAPRGCWQEWMQVSVMMEIDLPGEGRRGKGPIFRINGRARIINHHSAEVSGACSWSQNLRTRWSVRSHRDDGG